ncbi:MAG TPA: NAD(P)-dependent oxidoreductase [Rubrivivax sp.]
MRVLVTGASGRVGRALCARLAAEHEVIGLDCVASRTAGLVGDVGDRALLRRALRGIDAVVHTAALHAPHVGVRPDAEFERVNVTATRALLDEAAACGVARIVYTSTTALYGSAGRRPGQAAWIDETLEPEPLTVYHRSKLAAERLLAQAAAQGGPPVRLLRMGRCFPEPLPAMALYRLHRGIDVRDVAEAHAQALHDQGAACETYVVSAATPFERADAPRLAHDAATVIRQRAPALAAAFAQRGWPLPASIDRVHDTVRAQRAWGWRPRFGFEVVLQPGGAA